MKNINQSVSIEWSRNLWRFYKKYFLIVFLLVMIIGTFIATQIQKDQTRAEILLSASNTSSEVDNRPAILITYRELLMSEQAANRVVKDIPSLSEDPKKISSNLEFSQQTNSSLMNLTIANFSSEEGSKILRSIIDYANENIKSSYNDNEVNIISSIDTTKNSQKIDVKFLLITFVVAVFMGIIMLLFCDFFSSRILTSNELENFSIKIIAKVKVK